MPIQKQLEPQWFEFADPAAIRESSADGIPTSYIMLMPEGEYQHPEYGTLDFSRSKLEQFKAHFDNKVRKIEIALDVDHRANKGDSRATGWIDDVEFRDPNGGFPGGLWGCIKWTPYGTGFIENREYRYFSPEFGDFTDEASGKKFKDVLIGGALTNRPFLKVMPAVTLSEPIRRKIAKLARSGKSPKEIADSIAQLSEKEVKAFMATQKTPLLKQAQKRPTAKKPGDVDEYDPSDVDDATAFEEDEDEAEQYEEDEDEDEEESEAAEPDEDNGGPPSNHPEPDADNRRMSKKASSRGGKKMSEDGGHVSLAEFQRVQRQAKEQQRELAEVRYRVYEQDIDKMIAAWQRGKTISYEYGTTKTLSEAAVKQAKTSTRQGRIALTPKAARAIREFMITEGYRLSEDRRSAVVDLIQTLISDSAFVDTTQRGSAFDMDRPRSDTTPRRRQANTVGSDLVILAEQISSEQYNKPLDRLSPEDRLNVMMLAEKQAEEAE